jgi:RNA ligase (TIGR02306 family)
MSTLTVTAERLVIHPHPDADALELAQVGLFRAVVAKGAYRTGDIAFYIPEGALLPEPLIEELGLVGRLAGPAKDRVRAVRLRGELSQGIVCRPKQLDGVDLAAALAARRDFAAELGVTKWVPPVPATMSGQMGAAPDLIPWVEVENIGRYPQIFAPGEPVVATEKIHGTACLCTVVAATGEVLVSSKSFGHQRLSIVESDRNVYWRAVRAHDVPGAAAALAASLGAVRVGVFGEVYGTGVQDLGYATLPGAAAYAAFDVAVDTGTGVRWLDPAQMREALGGRLPVVPEVYAGPYDEAALVALASGTESVSGTGAHLREGIVVRAAVERYSPVTGGRAIGKLVSAAYLTRKGGTEYE